MRQRSVRAAGAGDHRRSRRVRSTHGVHCACGVSAGLSTESCHCRNEQGVGVKKACVWLALAYSVGLGLCPVRAEEAHPLTLKEAQEITLRNHPRISEAELEALASQQVVSQVRAGFLPNVVLNATAVDAFEANTRLAAGSLNNPSVFDREIGRASCRERE